ncbi:rolling circle replication-associated protein [Grimontia sp. NTOU-MAR1]|uniref:rolling circle replication-associated protein n=1 Tax=Grimontia sp. NTOU-MAR1 TaxID=3111011 RepID=UPI002DBB0FF7|nr:hypothetical protein [Grimontia sp. NTOU-MAR1]WRV98271.1 hypothetical protein VP504_02200 [Grimontia sp. NTOU-MAR1]
MDKTLPTLTQKDIQYIAGAAIPGDLLLSRLESPVTGETPKAWLESQAQKLRHADFNHWMKVRDTERPNQPPAGAEQSDGGTRLVQGCESPTRTKEAQRRTLIANQAKLLQHRADGGEVGIRFADQTPRTHHDDYSHHNAHRQSERNRAFRIMHQPWSGKYRAGIFVQPRPQDAPAPTTGARFTERLTPKAVGKIFESAAYVATLHNGFTTFLTLTFSPEARAKLFAGDDESPETTIGREVSRFLDGAKKVYQRGFDFHYVTERDGDDHPLHYVTENAPLKVRPRHGNFHYIWVAECPANEDGEPNPHVHVLLNWQVPKPLFRAWAERIESLWGHGLAHLERIKHGKAAGKYIIKAVGYAAKGDNGEQGLIRGNRYGIAKCSRAPGWECLATFEADCMGAIIAEYRHRLGKWKKPITRLRSKTKKKIAASARALQIVKKSKKLTPEQIQNRVQKLSARLTQLDGVMDATAAKIRECGRTVSDDHPLVHFDGENAREHLDRFLIWATGARGWNIQSDDIENCRLLKQQIKQQFNGELTAFRDELLIHEARVNWLKETGWNPVQLELNSYGEKREFGDCDERD